MNTRRGNPTRSRLRPMAASPVSACWRRALPVIREIVVKNLDQNVLVVSHKTTLRLIISSLLGFNGRGYRDRLDQAPACLNILDFKDPVRRG